jgi:hypothetical protein
MFDDPRWGGDPREGDYSPRNAHGGDCDRDDDGGPQLGRGPNSRVENLEGHRRDREAERPPDRDPYPRDRDPRDVFMRDLGLPRGREREIVHDREREYTLRGSESRTLATVGAFRVASSRDLREHDNRSADPRSGDLRHLREQGLVETVRMPGSRDQAVAPDEGGPTSSRRRPMYG